MRRKDLCGSVRAVYILGKLSDVSGSGLEEAGRYRWIVIACGSNYMFNQTISCMTMIYVECCFSFLCILIFVLRVLFMEAALAS